METRNLIEKLRKALQKRDYEWYWNEIDLIRKFIGWVDQNTEKYNDEKSFEELVTEYCVWLNKNRKIKLDLLKMKTKAAIKYLLSQGYNCEEIAVKLQKHSEYIRRARRRIKEENLESG